MTKEDIELVSGALDDAACIMDEEFFGEPMFEIDNPREDSALAEQIVAMMMGWA